MLKFFELKTWSAIILLIVLSACASTPDEPISNQVQVETDGGDVVSVVINSDDYVELTTDVAAEDTRQECFKTNAAMPTDSTAQALREMRLAVGGKVDCGAGKFDVAINEENQKTERTKTRWNTGERILGKGLIGAGVYGGLKVLGDIVETATENAGNDVVVQDGSTLEGNVGEGNTYTRTESRDGIPLNPTDAENITISQSGEDETNEESQELATSVVDFTTCLAANGDPVNTEGNVMNAPDDGIYFRCSDGSSGTITEF